MSKETMKLALEEYLCREMPAGTVIGDPKWWAGKIANVIAKQEQGEPVALKVYRGELCYKSQADDQSFGMWCPVTQDLPFPEGTKFYTTPQQRKPLTDNQLNIIGSRWNLNLLGTDEKAELFAFARAIEAAHGIKGSA